MNSPSPLYKPEFSWLSPVGKPSNKVALTGSLPVGKAYLNAISISPILFVIIPGLSTDPVWASLVSFSTFLTKKVCTLAR
ncbi:MAG: hypothetical protein IPO98_07575 [Saprospiraceae bacterium]|nr:hypothetical protein [Saprospiraceae bacterium]